MKKFIAFILILSMACAFGITAEAAIIETEEIEVMAYREIPAGAVEIQTGLFLLETPVTINGMQFIRRELFSAEGYCFWEVNQPENYDEEGNLLPPERRVYATYMTCGYATIEQINAHIISVPYEEGYEVVSVGGSHETA